MVLISVKKKACLLCRVKIIMNTDQERGVVASLALHAVLEPVFSEVCT